jgi:hypothetical protein
VGVRLVGAAVDELDGDLAHAVGRLRLRGGGAGDEVLNAARRRQKRI